MRWKRYPWASVYSWRPFGEERQTWRCWYHRYWRGILALLAALLFGSVGPSAVANPPASTGRPACVDGLPDDCAYIAAAESYRANPTAKTRRILRDLARRGHVGAQAFLLTSNGPSDADPADSIADFIELANRGVPSGFEGWGLALVEDPASREQAGEVLVQAMRRGPREAIATLALGKLDDPDTSTAERKIAEAVLVTACVMGSDVACHRAAYDRWDPTLPHHEPELAIWLAERAVTLGSEPASKLLALMLRHREPKKANMDRAVSLVLPHAEAGDPYAMYVLAGTLLHRDTDDDAERGVQWLEAAVQAGYVDAAQAVVGLSQTEPSRMSEAGLYPVLIDRAIALLEQESTELFTLHALVSAQPGFGVKQPERFAGIDPLVAGIEAASSGSVEALELLARHVIAEPDAVEDPAAFLKQVEESLCAVGPLGIPSYVLMVQALDEPMDAATQAAWLFLVPEQEPWDQARLNTFVSARDEVWSELSGAELVAAEAHAVQMRQEIQSTNPGCALVR